MNLKKQSDADGEKSQKNMTTKKLSKMIYPFRKTDFLDLSVQMDFPDPYIKTHAM